MNARLDLEVLAGPTLGGIDLVAIERVRNGQPTDLTDAEYAYLLATYDGTREQGQKIADALGITRTGVAKAAQRAAT